MNFYDILEVKKDCTTHDIKNSYKKLVLKYHPDKNIGVDTSEKFKDIQMAYEILINKDKKQQYDGMNNIQQFEFYNELKMYFSTKFPNFIPIYENIIKIIYDNEDKFKKDVDNQNFSLIYNNFINKISTFMNNIKNIDNTYIGPKENICDNHIAPSENRQSLFSESFIGNFFSTKGGEGPIFKETKNFVESNTSDIESEENICNDYSENLFCNSIPVKDFVEINTPDIETKENLSYNSLSTKDFVKKNTILPKGGNATILDGVEDLVDGNTLHIGYEENIRDNYVEKIFSKTPYDITIIKNISIYEYFYGGLIKIDNELSISFDCLINKKTELCIKNKGLPIRYKNNGTNLGVPPEKNNCYLRDCTINKSVPFIIGYGNIYIKLNVLGIDNDQSEKENDKKFNLTVKKILNDLFPPQN